jgi:hypothetical protein
MAGILPRLDKTMPIVKVTIRLEGGRTIEGEGVSTPEYQQFWQSAVKKADAAGSDLTGKVSQLSSVVYPGATISNPPTQGEVQAIANALAIIAEAMTE